MSVESAIDSGAELEPELEPKTRGVLRKCFLCGFATAVTVGLALASWYVGVRIVAADESGTARTAGSPAARSSTQEDSMADAYWYSVPPAAELYLEIAGSGPEQDARTIQELESKGYQARVKANTGGHLARILIGPFGDRAALDQAERALHLAGVVGVESER